MTDKEFLTKALLAIAGNSAFGSHRRSSYLSFDEWAADIEEAAFALCDIATKLKLVDFVEPSKPP